MADGDGAGGARIDIGAYERQNLPPEFFVVDTLIDDNDGNYSPATFRSARRLPPPTVAPERTRSRLPPRSVSGGPATILLLHGELAISESLTISGPGAGLLTIDASGYSRVLNIDDGKSASLVDVEISGLTLTGGTAIGSGGAIFTGKPDSGRVCRHQQPHDDHAVPQGGGAIYSSNGADVPNSLTIRNSTISDNYSVHVQIGFAEGGGIRKQYGSLIVEQSSISDNVADLGGGISAADGLVDVQIRSSTISGNSGAGVFLFGTSATTTITGSTISGNFGAGVYSLLRDDNDHGKYDQRQRDEWQRRRHPIAA